MSDVSPAIHALAHRIVGSEVEALCAGESLAARLALVFTRAHEVTAAMVGELGYLSLMARAVRTTRESFPFLPVLQSSLVVPGEPGFPRLGWQPYVDDAGPEVAAACASLLFANVLGLLASFIGEDFTFRLIRRAWPEDASGASRSESGET